MSAISYFSKIVFYAISVCVCLNPQCDGTLRERNNHFTRLAAYDNRLGDEIYIGKFKVRSKIECTMRCLEDEMCTSCFHSATLKQCQLHSGLLDLDRTVAADGWQYYGDECKNNVLCMMYVSNKLLWCLRYLSITSIKLI